MYRGKNIAWHNLERSLAYEHSPYDTTILMDCDYFVFTNNLLTYTDTKYDFLVHNKVHDLTGNNKILGKNEINKITVPKQDKNNPPEGKVWNEEHGHFHNKE